MQFGLFTEYQGKNKKSLCPCKQGQKLLYFCDTTQIDGQRPSTRFTHIHAYPTGNGRDSRRRLLPKGVRAALASPFKNACAAALTPSAALWIHPAVSTSLAHRFNILPDYSTALSDCQGFWETFFGPVTKRPGHRSPDPRRRAWPEWSFPAGCQAPSPAIPLPAGWRPGSSPPRTFCP